jgi:hypothetical protein
MRPSLLVALLTGLSCAPSPAPAPRPRLDAVDAAAARIQAAGLCGTYTRTDQSTYRSLLSTFEFLDGARVRYPVIAAWRDQPAIQVTRGYLVEDGAVHVIGDEAVLSLRIDGERLVGMRSPLDDAVLERKAPPGRPCRLGQLGQAERKQIEDDLCHLGARDQHGGSLERGIEAYRRCCDRGDARSCARLGTLVQDRSESASLFRRACDGGSGAGCYDLWLLLREPGLLARGCKAGHALACGALRDPASAPGPR